MIDTTEGITAIATITELRTNTSEVVDDTDEAVLIVKNSNPVAVLVDYDQYSEIVDGNE